MATLTTQSISRAGIVPSYAAATAGGDAMSCGPGMFLHAKNGSGGSITVTIAIPSGASGYTNVSYTNTAVAIAAGAEKMIGPIVAPLYQDPTTGLATITYSGVTSLTVGAFNANA